MGKDRTAGDVRRVKGSIKEAIGKITGDRETQAEGAAGLAVAAHALQAHAGGLREGARRRGG